MLILTVFAVFMLSANFAIGNEFVGTSLMTNSSDSLKAKFKSNNLGSLLTTPNFLLPPDKTKSNITAVGIQYKPIVPSSMFNTGPVTHVDTSWDITLTPELGHSFGMVIRKGFTDKYSLEVGINQVVRHYSLKASFEDSTFSGKETFKLVGYEVPLQGLLYVRLGEKVYMNNAFGISLDMFASPVDTKDYNFTSETIPRSWIQLGLIANVGFEYRSEKSGFFYLGGSLHRPFARMAGMKMTYYPEIGHTSKVWIDLVGNYLTIDFRYFFHADPEKKKKKKSPSNS